MFIFFLQLRETLHGGRLYVFTVLIAVTWLLWMVKVFLSNRYEPWVGDYPTTVSIVIPVVGGVTTNQRIVDADRNVLTR